LYCPLLSLLFLCWVLQCFPLLDPLPNVPYLVVALKRCWHLIFSSLPTSANRWPFGPFTVVPPPTNGGPNWQWLDVLHSKSLLVTAALDAFPHHSWLNPLHSFPLNLTFQHSIPSQTLIVVRGRKTYTQFVTPSNMTNDVLHESCPFSNVNPPHFSGSALPSDSVQKATKSQRYF